MVSLGLLIYKMGMIIIPTSGVAVRIKSMKQSVRQRETRKRPWRQKNAWRSHGIMKRPGGSGERVTGKGAEDEDKVREVIRGGEQLESMSRGVTDSDLRFSKDGSAVLRKDCLGARWNQGDRPIRKVRQPFPLGSDGGSAQDRSRGNRGWCVQSTNRGPIDMASMGTAALEFCSALPYAVVLHEVCGFHEGRDSTLLQVLSLVLRQCLAHSRCSTKMLHE